MIRLTLVLAPALAIAPLAQDPGAQPGPDICVMGSAKDRETMAMLRTEIDAMAVEIETLQGIRKKADASATTAQKDLRTFSSDAYSGRGGLTSYEDHFAGTYHGTEQGAAIQSSREHERSTAKKINRVIKLRENKILEFRTFEKKLKPQDCNAKD